MYKSKKKQIKVLGGTKKVLSNELLANAGIIDILGEPRWIDASNPQGTLDLS